MDDFKRKWKNEHGNYYTKDQLAKCKKHKKIPERGYRQYPKIRYVDINGKKTKALWLPGITWNDKKTQKKC